MQARKKWGALALVHSCDLTTVVEQEPLATSQKKHSLQENAQDNVERT